MRKIGLRTLFFPFFAVCSYEQSNDPLSLEFSAEPRLKKYCYLHSITKHRLLVIKSRRMRWTGYVALMGSGRVGISEEMRHLKDLGINGV
jgi:hypothetical protein